ncbi:MAG: hypothetical protein R3C97_03190 [Geminicoccaceae bacterium]
MSTTATHSPPTPGALFELALCILDGGSAQEAALASGIDPALAQRLVRHWAFVLLLKILPMVIGDRHRSRSGQPRSARERSRIRKAVQPILSLFTKSRTRRFSPFAGNCGNPPQAGEGAGRSGSHGGFR